MINLEIIIKCQKVIEKEVVQILNRSQLVELFL